MKPNEIVTIMQCSLVAGGRRQSQLVQRWSSSCHTRQSARHVEHNFYVQTVIEIHVLHGCDLESFGNYLYLYLLKNSHKPFGKGFQQEISMMERESVFSSCRLDNARQSWPWQCIATQSEHLSRHQLNHARTLFLPEMI